MADIPIKFYKSVVRSQTFNPTNSPDLEEPAPFVNPPGSIPTTLYKLLGDVTDTDFIGKNGRVPVVNDENVLTLEPILGSLKEGLLDGGIVQWTGIGYIFNISRAIARFTQVLLDSLTDSQVTLTTADPTNDRIDLFILQVGFDVNGIPISITPDKITGTPSGSPVKPQIDPSTQIELTQITVTASSTTPTLTEEVIYDENIEWAGSTTGTGTVAFNSAVNPYQGSLSIEATNIENGLKIRLTDGADYDLSTVQTLGMQINLKATMGAGINIGVTFLNSSANPISSELILNHDKGLLGYQFVGIALSQFSFTSFLARSIEFRYIRTKGTVVYSGFFLDIIKLEGGINPPQTVGNHNQLRGLQGGNATERYHTNKDQNDAIIGANNPSAGNVFATMADVGGGGMPPIDGSYASQALMIADQVNQTAQYIYFDSVQYWEYLGTTLGTIADYKKLVIGVSPYDLKQEGATDGQVVTWVAANSRYEPVTFAGSSNWTIVGLNIYRLSGVGIQTSTIPANTALVIQSPTILNTYKIISILNNTGTEFFGITQNGGFTFGSTATYNFAGRVIVNSTSSGGNGLFDARNSINGSNFIGRNNAGTVTFNVTADGAIVAVGCAFTNNRNTMTGLGLSSGGAGVLDIKTTSGSILRCINSVNVVQFRVGPGEVNLYDSVNFVFATIIGTKIGTATNQKFAFWNKTPIIQPTNTITASSFAANTSGIANDTATFGGYTIGQIAAALINTGILA